MWALLGGAAQPLLSGVNKALTFGRWQAPETLPPERAHPHLSVSHCKVAQARPGTLRCQFPAAAFEQPSTSHAELETAIQRLSARASDWQALEPTERSSLLQECVLSIKQVRWPAGQKLMSDMMFAHLGAANSVGQGCSCAVS